MSKKIGECQCCQIEDVELNIFSTTGYEGCKLCEKKEFEFCDFCYSTFAGNSFLYPSQYGDRGEILRQICAVANIILKKQATLADSKRS